MEKFRQFGDAATGINPFTITLDPSTIGVLLAGALLPLRLLTALLCVLLLLLTDIVVYVLYCLYLGCVARTLLAPVQRLILRCLLLSLSQLIVDVSPSVTSAHSQATSKKPREDPRLAAGDVLFVNLQSPWDAMVLEVGLATPLYAVVFPSSRCGEVTVFWPGPLQRWRVWRYILLTGSLAYLQACAKKAPAMLDLTVAQRCARRYGMPVVFFGEGTCSNGRGVLQMDGVQCCSAAAGRADACVLHTASVTYETPAVHTVVVDGGFMGYLFGLGALLWGSATPASYSPAFPSAVVALEVVTVEPALHRVVDEDRMNSEKVSTEWALDAAGTLELRHAMCQRGRAVVNRGPGIKGRRRQPLAVGVNEKLGFVEAYLSMTRAKKGSSLK